ncbi:DUF1697 domain-containing protein [Companilactobacillus sp. DQM5]|uniref:DUF1697 domain-containing protein n=1 Tax=Companilactobacillus sp. DQM5 TaxID=3463359 RepID=UPI0040586F71
MKKFIVLLRGINVGGKNKIPMKELKENLERYFFNVLTYLNTGNIILESDKDEVEIQNEIHNIILEKFECDIFTLCINSDDYLEMMNNLPEWFGKNKEDKNNFIFVIKPYSGKEIVESIGEGKPEFERVDYFKNVIFWSAPLKTFSKTRWSKIVGTKEYKYITIRNIKTAKKLSDIIQNE